MLFFIASTIANVSNDATQHQIESAELIVRSAGLTLITALSVARYARDEYERLFPPRHKRDKGDKQ